MCTCQILADFTLYWTFIRPYFTSDYVCRRIRKGWFSNTSFTTGLKTLPTFRPDALVFFRAKMLKKTRASGRNVGKVFNPVVKLVLENQPMLHCAAQQGHTELVQIVIEELKLNHTARDKVCVRIHSCLDLACKVCLC